jgi:hypothetical protein
MKSNTSRAQYVFELWDKRNLTFRQIAEQKIPAFLSLKTIRNIVYAGASGRDSVRLGVNSGHGREIYKMFRLKFCELQDVGAAIRFVYENQPPRSICVKQVRKIITGELKKRSAKSVNA